MASSKNQHKQSGWTTASQLAEMGFCESKLVLKHRLGSRESISRQAAQRVGTFKHRQFLNSAFHEQPTVSSSMLPDDVLCIGRTASLRERLFRLIKRFLGLKCT
jgi:hypothetical protein